MGSKERKEFERRQTIEASYEHPPADIRATRLSFGDAGPTVARLARHARLTGFEVELWGLIGTAPPSWRRRGPEDAQLSYWGMWGTIVTLRAYRPSPPRHLGLQAFVAQWTRGTPSAWLKYASWPMRKSNVTELGRILADEYADVERYYIDRADLRERGVIE